MTGHWADLALQTRGLESLYFVIPPLDSVRLRSFHLDWRGPTLTARIDLPSYPGDPPPDWSDNGHNTLQVHLQFLAVENLTVCGWIPSTPVDISFSAMAERRMLTKISGVDLELSFTCSDSLAVGHISSSRVTESGSDNGPHSFLQPLDARRFPSLPSTHESTFYERV
ncbi:immunity 50 family protein [Streptomyces microflavus]|uniref:Imm50 family immunity protein n=1 Tax=Streptomyces microflavus TaxID=1919 RepID=UPI0029AFFACD|nr:Imm50 family immunity protein [Streptomyces microflavus]MDX2402463.1 immunity 50 family protein [Streptomyces microflavus]